MIDELSQAIQDFQTNTLWFDGTEAKLRSDTVLDVCAAELKDLEKDILKTDNPSD